METTSIAAAVGPEIYRQANCDPAAPPAGGAVRLAINLFGPDVIRLQPRAFTEGDIATINGSQHIVIRREVSAGRLNFLVGQQVVRLFLRADAWYTALNWSEQDEVERAVGAWLVAPPEPFRAQAGKMGEDVGALARAFAITETCCCKRLWEVSALPSVVTTPTLVHRSGDLLRGLADASVRDLAARSSPRSVRRLVLGDEPGRVALFARAS